MYVPRGFGYSEVGDIEVFPLGDELHLFHLTLPNHDLVQHAVTTDGLSWRGLPAALRTSDPGACDDDQIWTMSVTEHDGQYIMLYTALGKAEDGQVQRTASAVSTDLFSWTKSDRNPVAAADSRWYEASRDDSGRVSWRDPKPVRHDGTYYAAVCAREKDGPFLRRGCVGLMTSTDLQTWEVRPPLFTPRRYWDLECPQVFTINGTFYLTAGIMEDRTQRYWMATSITGPYLVPPDGGVLAPLGHYAGRLCTWQGRHLYLCWHRPGRQDGPVDVDWTTMVNTAGKFVVAPLVLAQREDGSLRCESFPGWAAYQETPLSEPPGMTTSRLRGSPILPASPWSLTASPGEMDLLLTESDVQDVYAEGTIRLDATIGGLAFRVDAESSAGYFIELQAGAREVILKKWLLIRDQWSGQPWFRMEILQRDTLNQPFPAGTPVAFTLILSGPYIELALAGEVVLATLSGERQSGRLGPWTESGTITVRDFRAAPLRPLQHR
ncbi:MAG: hypothetical protein M3509_12225 [Chloroflexota bacterium]|nr:hypothetical protein [Chloroflexota bacterium]